MVAAVKSANLFVVLVRVRTRMDEKENKQRSLRVMLLLGASNSRQTPSCNAYQTGMDIPLRASSHRSKPSKAVALRLSALIYLGSRASAASQS